MSRILQVNPSIRVPRDMLYKIWRPGKVGHKVTITIAIMTMMDRRVINFQLWRGLH